MASNGQQLIIGHSQRPGNQQAIQLRNPATETGTVHRRRAFSSDPKLRAQYRPERSIPAVRLARPIRESTVFGPIDAAAHLL